MRKLALILLGIALANCVGVLIAVQHLKHLYVTVPPWLLLWLLCIALVAGSGILLTILYFLGYGE